jgi:hypothetical protein
MAAKEWTNRNHVNVCISRRNFLPNPSVEWCDKKIGSADLRFAPNKPFPLDSLAVNPLQPDFGS